MFNWITRTLTRNGNTFKPLNGADTLPKLLGWDSSNAPKVVTDGAEACTLSPFWAALRLFQTTVGSLPLVTYTRNQDGGRERARTNPAYNLLHQRPNPAQSRSTFFEYLIKELVWTGNAYVLIRRDGAGNPLALYPVPTSAVERVEVDDDWRKRYTVNMTAGKEVFRDDEIVHLFQFSEDGLQGKSLILYAAESLGLHRQVMESANSFFKNACRPSVYVRLQGQINENALKELVRDFRANYQGTNNAGSVPFLSHSGEIVPVGNGTAEDQQLIQALGAGTQSIGQWFGVSPLALGDLSRGTYSNLAADNAAFYQRSIRPLLDKIELELNDKLFGGRDDTYCEFLLSAILAGDPAEQASIATQYLQAGVILRNEVREQLNLNRLPGLDQPLHPLNQGTELATPAPEPSTSENDAPTQPDAPAA